MKRTVIIFILFLFTTILVACNTSTTTKTTISNNTTNNTTENTTSTDTTNQTTTTTATTQTTVITTTAVTTVDPRSAIYDVAPSLDMCNGIEDQGDYKIAWCDEFNYRGLPDTKKWKYDVGGNGWGNNELQYYKSADRDNVFVENDNLVITALKETVGTNNYTSTRLLSAGKAEFLYGRMEIRAMLPGERGTWPALWMLGNYGKYGWPGCGEIDIMEHVANDLNVVHGSIHTTNYNHKDGTQKTNKLKLDDVVNEYHIYSIEWTPKQIRFFIDGENYFTFNNDEINNPDGNQANWPFDEKMFFILNIAIGGWGGNVDPNFKQAQMFVDYVRVYQKTYDEVDTTNPSDIENIQVLSNTPTNTLIKWDATNDDTGIKFYEVYANEILKGTTQTPKFSLTDLDQNQLYNIKIVAVDFAGNRSNDGTVEVTTTGYPTAPTKIEAEYYVEMSGVSLENTTDVGGGQNVGWTDLNDYMIYKINVTETATYKVSYRVASHSTGGGIGLYSNGNLLATTTFTGTGGWQNWTSVETETFTLEAGLHTIKLLVTKAGFNINYIEFIKVE